MVEEIYKKIELAIKQSNRILIVGHEKPDVDALGSIFAMSRYAESLGKEYNIFLKGYEATSKMLYFNNVINEEEIDWQNFDLLISLDSGNLNRSGLKELPEKRPMIIDIDHHDFNVFFGDINLVDVKASSTTHIVTLFFEHINYKFDSKIATALLFGIITDTDNFLNKATTIDSFNVASRLIKAGASLLKINLIKQNKNIEILKFQGKNFKRLEKNNKYDLAYSVIVNEELEKAKDKGMIGEDMRDLSNFLNNLKDSKFSMIVKEEPNVVKFSLRTTRDDINLAKLSSFFGGGGHQKAAGFSIQGKLQKTENGWIVVKNLD